MVANNSFPALVALSELSTAAMEARLIMAKHVLAATPNCSISNLLTRR
ncbi:MAG: hypothetical protein VW891_04475 [Novosphingobium sp.]